MCQFWTHLNLSDHKIFFVVKDVVLLPTQHVYTLAVSFVMGAAQWMWFKSTPLHYDLERRGGAGKSERCCQSWPEHWPCCGPTFSPLFLSLSAAPLVVSSFYKLDFHFAHFFAFSFGVSFWDNFSIILLHISQWLYLYVVTQYLFLCPSPVCAMAVRNCLECQQAQCKHGAEGTLRSYTAMPSTVLGTAKSASAQASNPDHVHFIITHDINFLYLLKMSNNIGNLSYPFSLLHWSSFEFFTLENSHILPLPFSCTQ